MCEIILYKFEIWIGYWWEKWEVGNGPYVGLRNEKYIINVDSFLKSPVVLNNIRLFILYTKPAYIENPIFLVFHIYFICFVYIIINSYCVQMTSSIFIHYYMDNTYAGWDIIGRWEIIGKKQKNIDYISNTFPFSFCYTGVEGKHKKSKVKWQEFW